MRPSLDAANASAKVGEAAAAVAVPGVGDSWGASTGSLWDDLATSPAAGGSFWIVVAMLLEA